MSQPPRTLPPTSPATRFPSTYANPGWGAEDCILVSPLGFQEGAKKITAAEGIQEILMDGNRQITVMGEIRSVWWARLAARISHYGCEARLLTQADRHEAASTRAGSGLLRVLYPRSGTSVSARESVTKPRRRGRRYARGATGRPLPRWPTAGERHGRVSGGDAAAAASLGAALVDDDR